MLPDRMREISARIARAMAQWVTEKTSPCAAACSFTMPKTLSGTSGQAMGPNELTAKPNPSFILPSLAERPVAGIAVAFTVQVSSMMRIEPELVSDCGGDGVMSSGEMKPRTELSTICFACSRVTAQAFPSSLIVERELETAHQERVIARKSRGIAFIGLEPSQPWQKQFPPSGSCRDTGSGWMFFDRGEAFPSPAARKTWPPSPRHIQR